MENSKVTRMSSIFPRLFTKLWANALNTRKEKINRVKVHDDRSAIESLIQTNNTSKWNIQCPELPVAIADSKQLTANTWYMYSIEVLGCRTKKLVHFVVLKKCPRKNGVDKERKGNNGNRNTIWRY